MLGKLGKTVESLLLSKDENDERDDASLFSFYGLQSPKVDKSKEPFHCTGERLFRDRPDVYRAAVEMVAEGVGTRRICRICNMSPHTLTSVVERESVPIATHKKVIAAKSGRVANMLLDRIEELAPTMVAKDAIVGFGVTTDKHLLMTGDATARVEITAGENVIANFKAYCDDLAKRVEAGEIGFLEQKKLTKGAAGPPAIEAEIVPETDSTTDIQTDHAQESDPAANDLANEHAATRPSLEEGGEGGVAPARAAENPNR